MTPATRLCSLLLGGVVLALADGRCTGTGAEWLVQQARAAQFA